MAKHRSKLAVPFALGLAAAAAWAGTVQAQYAPSIGPWFGTWAGPGGSRCFSGTWSRETADGGRVTMQGQFCYSGANNYPNAFGSSPWVNGYPAYPGTAGPYGYPFYQGYGPRPFPNSYPWPAPWAF
jgi:hypothetical protein